MTTLIPCVQIFEDVPEKVSSVSLEQDLLTGTNIAIIRFQTLASLAHFLCFKRRSGNTLHLIDAEGEIWIQSSIKMIYSGPEGENLKGVECKLAIAQDAHWDRFMRFIHRYAEAHGLTQYGSVNQVWVKTSTVRMGEMGRIGGMGEMGEMGER